MKNFIKISFVTLALLLATNASAQLLPVSLGIKGGVNLSNMNIKHAKTKSKTGYNAGLTLDINLPANLAIMSGLELNTKGTKIKGTDASINAMYLQLPVHLGYRVKLVPGVSAHFDFGPYFAQGLEGKIKYSDEDGSYKENTFSDDGFKKFDWGLGVGVGVTFLGKIQVRAGYDHGLANIGRKVELGGEVLGDVKVKNRNAFLSVGYKFF